MYITLIHSFLLLLDSFGPVLSHGIKTGSTIESQVVSRKKLTNHNRLFFLHLTMIGQFLAAYDLRLYCRTGL